MITKKSGLKLKKYLTYFTFISILFCWCIPAKSSSVLQSYYVHLYKLNKDRSQEWLATKIFTGESHVLEYGQDDGIESGGLTVIFIRKQNDLVNIKVQRTFGRRSLRPKVKEVPLDLFTTRKTVVDSEGYQLLVEPFSEIQADQEHQTEGEVENKEDPVFNSQDEWRHLFNLHKFFHKI